MCAGGKATRSSSNAVNSPIFPLKAFLNSTSTSIRSILLSVFSFLNGEDHDTARLGLPVEHTAPLHCQRIRQFKQRDDGDQDRDDALLNKAALMRTSRTAERWATNPTVRNRRQRGARSGTATADDDVYCETCHRSSGKVIRKRRSRSSLAVTRALLGVLSSRGLLSPHLFDGVAVDIRSQSAVRAIRSAISCCSGLFVRFERRRALDNGRSRKTPLCLVTQLPYVDVLRCLPIRFCPLTVSEGVFGLKMP